MLADSSLEQVLTALEQLTQRMIGELEQTAADAVNTDLILECLATRDEYLERLKSLLRKPVQEEVLFARLRQLQAQEQTLLTQVKQHLDHLRQQQQILSQNLHATTCYLEPDQLEATSLYFEQQG